MLQSEYDTSDKESFAYKMIKVPSARDSTRDFVVIYVGVLPLYCSSDVDHLERSDGALGAFVAYGTTRAGTSLLDVLNGDEPEDDGCLAT